MYKQFLHGYMITNEENNPVLVIFSADEERKNEWVQQYPNYAKDIEEIFNKLNEIKEV